MSSIISNYTAYTISYRSPASGAIAFKLNFGNIYYGMYYIKTHYGFALRERYFDIYGHFGWFGKRRITLKELRKAGIIGPRVQDEVFGDYYKYE